MLQIVPLRAAPEQRVARLVGGIGTARTRRTEYDVRIDESRAAAWATRILWEKTSGKSLKVTPSRCEWTDRVR